MKKVRKFSHTVILYLKRFRKALGPAPSETTWY